MSQSLRIDHRKRETEQKMVYDTPLHTRFPLASPGASETREACQFSKPSSLQYIDVGGARKIKIDGYMYLSEFAKSIFSLSLNS